MKKNFKMLNYMTPEYLVSWNSTDNKRDEKSKPITITGDSTTLARIELANEPPMMKNDVVLVAQSFMDIYKSNEDMQSGSHFAPPIAVRLSSFYNTFKNAFDTIDHNTKYGAIKFIHRYDIVNNTWYLTAECGLLNKIGVPFPEMGVNKHAYTILSSVPRYDIKQGSIAESSFSQQIDNDYINNIKIDSTPYIPPVNYSDLDNLKHVSSFIFPWDCELLRLIQDNGFNDSDASSAGANIEIVFASYSRFHSVTPHPQWGGSVLESLVSWPHQVAVHLNDSNQLNNPYLDNVNHGPNLFKGKAANYSTLCPPRSPVGGDYYWPLALPSCG